MTPQELLFRIQDLPAETPKFRALELALKEGTGYGRAWYLTQKEHWQGWLGEYDGPGAYGRKEWASRDAAFAWNHIVCAPMLFWLVEALGLPEADLDHAFQAVIAANPRGAAQCAVYFLGP